MKNKTQKQQNMIVIVSCVNYSDYLKLSLPFNIQNTKNIVVATTPTDTETIKLCDSYKITCFQTELFNGSDVGVNFFKTRGLNACIKAHITDNTWVLYMDADTILPYDFTEKTLSSLDKECIYTYARVRTNSTSNQQLKVIHNCHTIEDALKCKGVAPRKDGWPKIAGYFQLFHTQSQYLNTLYLNEQYVLTVADWYFSEQWPISNRVLLEGFCIHLGSCGLNWSGVEQHNGSNNSIAHENIKKAILSKLQNKVTLSKLQNKYDNLYLKAFKDFQDRIGLINDVPVSEDSVNDLSVALKTENDSLTQLKLEIIKKNEEVKALQLNHNALQALHTRLNEITSLASTLTLKYEEFVKLFENLQTVKCDSVPLNNLIESYKQIINTIQINSNIYKHELNTQNKG